MSASVALHQLYTPATPAREVHASDARYKVIVTGRQASKTTCAAEQFLEQIYSWDLPRALRRPYNPGAARPGSAEYRQRTPRLHYWVVAPTYKLVKVCKRRLASTLPARLVEHMNTGANIWWLKPDIMIEFVSAKHYDELVSATLDGLWLDEAALIHPEAWQGRLIPSLAVKGGWAIFTTTPLGRNWVYTQLVEPALRGEPDYKFFTWWSEQNDAVPGLQAEVLRQKQVLSPQYFEREYRASFDSFLGQAFPEWGDQNELLEIPRDIVWVRKIGGLDWGSANPGALVVTGRTVLGHWYALDEIYEENKLVEDFWAPKAKEMGARWQVPEWVCDPAEPDNIVRFRRAGLRAVRHSNAMTGEFDEHRRSVNAGVRTLNALIHQGRLFADKKRCPHLCADIRNARWDKDSEGKWEEKLANTPEGRHALDAGRYAITHAEKPPTLRPLG